MLARFRDRIEGNWIESSRTLPGPAAYDRCPSFLEPACVDKHVQFGSSQIDLLKERVVLVDTQKSQRFDVRDQCAAATFFDQFARFGDGLAAHHCLQSVSIQSDKPDPWRSLKTAGVFHQLPQRSRQPVLAVLTAPPLVPNLLDRSSRRGCGGQHCATPFKHKPTDASLSARRARLQAHVS